MRRAVVAAVIAAGLLCGACDGGVIDWTGAVAPGENSEPPLVVFLSTVPSAMLPPEEAAALAWLRERSDFRVQEVQFVDLPRQRLPPEAVLWWHYAEEAALPSVSVRRASLRVVRDHLRNGGSMLLSLIAASYVVPLEIEASPPNTVSLRAPFLAAEAEVVGLQSRNHPLVRSSWGAALPSANPAYARPAVAAYTGDRWPDEGRAWAVHRDDRGVDASIKVGTEYVDLYGTNATVLTLGAYCYFADGANHNRAQLEQLIADALAYLHNGRTVAATAPDSAPLPPQARGAGERSPYWGPTTTTFSVVDIDATAALPAPDLESALNQIERRRSEIEVGRFDDPAPFALATPEAVLRGLQNGRFDEFRVHPRRLLSDLRFALVRPDRGVTWLDEGVGSHRFTARPEGSELQFTDGETEVRVLLALDRRDAALVALITVRSPAAVELIAAWRSHGDGTIGDTATAAPTIGWDDGAQAFVWTGADGRITRAGFGQPTTEWRFGFRPADDLGDTGLLAPGDAVPIRGEAVSVPSDAVPVPSDAVPVPSDAVPIPGDASEAVAGDTPEAVAIDASEAVAIDASEAVAADLSFVAAQIRVAPGQPAMVPFVVVSGGAPGADPAAAFAALIADPGRVWADNADYFRDFLGRRTLGILTPDNAFQDAFKWAKVGIETLRTNLPGVGSGITTAVGDETDRNDWVGARGSVAGTAALWASMAADAYGDRELAAATLRAVVKYQGIDGRIPQALAPGPLAVESGVATTAMFLIALERHLATWGDRRMLAEMWPATQAALSYLLRRDGDGDGLIDGYGFRDRWSEDRAVQTPVDLAAMGVAALHAAARIATYQGDAEVVDATTSAAEVARDALNSSYWNAIDRRFYFARRSDASMVPAATVLPAVPIMWGLFDAGLVTAALDTFATDAFTQDWGVRMIGTMEEDGINAAGVEIQPPTGLPTATAGAAMPPPTGLPTPTADVISPVFTGWASLAAYAGRRPDTAFAQAMTNLLLLQRANAGIAVTAFDPQDFSRTDAVAQSAAAQAMTLLPIMRGMLGIVPDAMNGTVSIHPQLPAGWNDRSWSRVVVDHVRVGDSEFRLQIRRSFTETEYRVDRWLGTRDLTLRFTADAPAELLLALDANLAGFERIADEEATEQEGRRFLSVEVRPSAAVGPSIVIFRHDPYPQLIQSSQPTARRRETSSGLRVIRSGYVNGMMRIEAQGLPGRTYTLRLLTPWNVSQIIGVTDAQIRHADDGVAVIDVTVPGSGVRYRPLDLEVRFSQ